MAGARILDFVGGYIEYVFVPPFVGEWQRVTAERSVAHTRTQTYARLVADTKAVERNMRMAEGQIERVLETMSRQEEDLRRLTGSPAQQEQRKTVMATYCVNLDTVRKLRKVFHIMARIRSELLLRTTVLQTVRDSVALGRSPEYVDDFGAATKMLLESEAQTAEMMEIMYEETMDGDGWDEAVRNFIEQAGNYRAAEVPTTGAAPAEAAKDDGTA